MLVLSMRVGQRLLIGDDIVVVITKIGAERVQVAVEAPRHMRVLRAELLESDNNEPEASATDPRLAASATPMDNESNQET